MSYIAVQSTSLQYLQDEMMAMALSELPRDRKRAKMRARYKQNSSCGHICAPEVRDDRRDDEQQELRSRRWLEREQRTNSETAVDVENQMGITPSKRKLFLDNLPLLDIHNLQKHFLAAFVMYSQGLMYLWSSECNAQMMLQALVGSSLEGILVIRFLMQLFSGTSIWRKVLTSTLFLSNIFCIHASIVFMKKTGSQEMPDMWVLMEGMKNVKAYAKSELSGDAYGEVWFLILTLAFCAIPSAVLIFGIGASKHTNKSSRLLCRGKNPRKRPIGAIGSLFLIAPSIVLYWKGAWMPIFHTYASLIGSLIFSPPGSEGIELTPLGLTLQNSKRKGPNVVFVIHESLSGEHMLTSKAYSKMMPFVEQMMHSKDEYFVFENVRTVSGDTVDAVTALQSGCLPLNHEEGRETALKTTLATQFKARGYDTVSFSSNVLRNLKRGKWFMLGHQLTDNFDTVFHPDVTKDPLVNEAAQDDILMGDNFKDWLALRRKEMDLDDEERKPFFAQFYFFNSHYPFYNNKNVSKTESRIDGMFKTVDKSIEDIFNHLRDAGELDNTIVIGSGDHGENLKKGDFSRLHTWKAAVLHPLTYMYIPRVLAHAENQPYLDNLRYNTHQLVSTLDIFPTLMNLADGISLQNNYPETNHHCVRGYDLLSTRIASDRVAWSFPGVEYDFGRYHQGNMALHCGTKSSLLNRFGYPFKNGMNIIKYGNVIGSSTNEAEIPYEEWNNIIQNISGTPDEVVLAQSTSKFIASFREALKVRIEIQGNDDSTVKFCGTNKWLGTNISCEKRAQFLVDTHNMSAQSAKSSLLESGCQCNT